MPGSSFMPWLAQALAMLAACTVLAGAAAAAGVSKAKSPPTARAPSTQPQTLGDPVAGMAKADSERCQECHGVGGHGIVQGGGNEGVIAKLAGQFPGYIVKQVQDFRSGARKHDLMAIMARSVDDADVRDIAAYFASQSRMHGSAEPASFASAQWGRRLYAEGDVARGIAACASCHGEAGQGGVINGVVNPVIGGQTWRYLDAQLRQWRSSERRNSAQGVMTLAAKGLSDADIQALSDYLSAP